jgi:hypothetical protein
MFYAFLCFGAWSSYTPDPSAALFSWLSLQVLWIVELTPLTLAVFTPPARYPSAAPDSPDPGSMPNIVSEAPRKAAEVLGIPSSSPGP